MSNKNKVYVIILAIHALMVFNLNDKVLIIKESLACLVALVGVDFWFEEDL